MGDMSEANDVPSTFAGIAAGLIVPIGRFQFGAVGDTWWWSDEVYRIYGYEPGRVAPTTELLVAHQHPEDRHQAVHRLVTALAREKSVSTRFRIIDAHLSIHTVIMAATARHDPLGRSSASTVI